MERYTKKVPTENYSTHFYLQNETSNNEIHQEVFEKLHRKGDAMWKYEVFRNAAGSVRVSAYGAGWWLGKGRKWGWRDAAMYIGICSVVVEAFMNFFQRFSNFRFFDQISACSPLSFRPPLGIVPCCTFATSVNVFQFNQLIILPGKICHKTVFFITYEISWKKKKILCERINYLVLCFTNRIITR